MAYKTICAAICLSTEMPDEQHNNIEKQSIQNQGYIKLPINLIIPSSSVSLDKLKKFPLRYDWLLFCSVLEYFA